MDWKKPIKFKIGSEDWEMPLNVLIMLIAITLALMGLGAWMGFQFGS
ncbi:hypothetical protein J0A68_03565 [Algoriphagus sp. H41]|uniref:Uncharacterized protein n=1 Tax=Algoriphagus oliviformis TaxID=2811231 RepID=A0ABS3BZB0_9BACT|nr:hypothetical protein [Algoriphagus oliviformis]MBN7810018.1 hypothetical protein [Algoriphagus oliviformis]